MPAVQGVRSGQTVVVVGAGVSGLTTAFKLASHGDRVTLVSRDDPQETTSAVAAAFWWPYDLEPVDRARAWATQSFAHFKRLVGDTPNAGVRMRSGIYRQPIGGAAPWFCGMLEWKRTREPNANVITHSFKTPIIDMPIYLEWLKRQCAQTGVIFKQSELKSLHEIDDADIVVNCTGLGARSVIGDTLVRPVRGQVVVMAETGIDEFVKDESQPGVATYIYPRINTVILGGTTETSDATTPSELTTSAIIERCAAIDSRVLDGRVVNVLVGLRPHRATIRLDAEHQPGHPLTVHNYGHGRAGVSISWGCAAEVVRLIHDECT